MAQRLKVKGYRELLRACDRASREIKRDVRAALKDVGEHVRAEAAELFSSRYDAKSAAGYRVRVRQRGVFVAQSLRKTTGTRPDYGSLQMRKALLPALKDKREDVERELEHALDRLADRFSRD